MTADYALGDLNNIIKSAPNVTLQEQYMISISNFIRNGDRFNSEDLLQAYTARQLYDLILYCKNDFTLLLFFSFFLAETKVRETCSAGFKYIHLYIDLIYSKTLIYEKVNINPLSLSEKYELAESFVNNHKHL